MARAVLADRAPLAAAPLPNAAMGPLLHRASRVLPAPAQLLAGGRAATLPQTTRRGQSVPSNRRRMVLQFLLDPRGKACTSRFPSAAPEFANRKCKGGPAPGSARH